MSARSAGALSGTGRTVSVVPRTDLARPIAEAKAELFKALSHSPRIRIIEALAQGELAVSELQPIVGIEASHLSQQLGILRRAGLVTPRKEGSSVIYAITDPALVDLFGVAKRLLINSLSSTEDLLADLRRVER